MIAGRTLIALVSSATAVAFVVGIAAGAQLGGSDSTPAAAVLDTEPSPHQDATVASNVVGFDLDIGAADAAVAVTEAAAPIPLQIISPPQGWTYTGEAAVFVGLADPGSVIRAGDVETIAAGDGSWSLVLGLSDGPNVTKIEAVKADGETEATARTVHHSDKPKTKPAAAQVAAKPAPADSHKAKDHGGTHDDHKKKDGTSGEAKDSTTQPIVFSANQKYGSCGESLPYDVFSGKAEPGTTVSAASLYGSATTVAGADGRWKVKVEFPVAPVGEHFTVSVSDGTTIKTFDFVRKGDSPKTH